jgi:hypothetical protein
MLIASVGALLLIILALGGAVLPGNLWRALLVTIGAVVLWVVGINLFLPLSQSYPEAMTSSVARYAIDQFSRTAETSYLFVIEGSSVTARGLNGGLLQQRLKADGISATVIQLSLDGANHVERLEILKEFVGGLSASAKATLTQTKTVFCQEVEAGYDRSPFNHVDSNQFTDRTLAYLNVRNLPEITRWFFARYGFREIAQRRDLTVALATHALFNAFRIGYFQRTQRDRELDSTPGFTPNEERRSDFNPTGPLPLSFDLSHLKKEEKSFQKFTRWNRVRDQDFRRVLQGTSERELFFSVPNWRPYDVAYDLWRSTHSGHALYFSGNSASVRTALSNPDLWSDPTHLKSAGADIYTEQLAAFLQEQIKSGKL